MSCCSLITVLALVVGCSGAFHGTVPTLRHHGAASSSVFHMPVKRHSDLARVQQPRRCAGKISMQLEAAAAAATETAADSAASAAAESTAAVVAEAVALSPAALFGGLALDTLGSVLKLTWRVGVGFVVYQMWLMIKDPVLGWIPPQVKSAFSRPLALIEGIFKGMFMAKNRKAVICVALMLVYQIKPSVGRKIFMVTMVITAARSMRGRMG